MATAETSTTRDTDCSSERNILNDEKGYEMAREDIYGYNDTMDSDRLRRRSDFQMLCPYPTSRR